MHRPPGGIACASLVAFAALTLAFESDMRGAIRPPSGTIDVDPCMFATEDTLRTMLQEHIAAHFPIKSGSVRMSDPRVVRLTCPFLRAEIRADIRYRKTTGVPQYSTSGTVRLRSPVVARVTYSGSTPSSSNITKAEACLTDIDVIGLNLTRVPNWLDNRWVRGKVNENFADSRCFPVGPVVIAHLQGGGQLQ